MHIYFYNAMRSPELMARSVEELVQNVTLADTYRGDMTAAFVDDVNDAARSGCEASLKETLAEYDFFLDPSLDELEAKNKRCGLRAGTHLNNITLY